MRIALVDLLCLYGYSLSIFIPASVGHTHRCIRTSLLDIDHRFSAPSQSAAQAAGSASWPLSVFLVRGVVLSSFSTLLMCITAGVIVVNMSVFLAAQPGNVLLPTLLSIVACHTGLALVKQI